MDGPQLERRAQERVAAGKGIKKEAENITDRNINASENSLCTTSTTECSRADVSLSDRSHDRILDNDTLVKPSNGFHDECSGENSSSFPDSLDVSYLANKANKIQQIVEDATSPESKEVVTKILDQVQQLSVSEKLLLYLKLPTGNSISVDPLTQPINPLGSRFEIQQTITWIKTHLEEDPDVSLPKQDVYDEYLGYCNNNAMKPLSTADFGKVMKQVFPRVRPRRLGTRGNSRYCYSGLRKRMKLDPPLLPDLGDLSRIGSHKGVLKGSGCIVSGDDSHQASPEQSGEDTEMGMGDVDREEGGRDLATAASHLVREWAEKLLGNRFTSLPELARHLVKNLCVDGRSVAAFTLLSADQHVSRNQGISAGSSTSEAGDRKCVSPGVPILPNLCKTGGKHREAQLQLQRKLQEKEIIREQKRKIQDQQTAFRGGVPLERSKSQTGKKAKLGNSFNNSNHLKRSNSDDSSASANKICHVESIMSHAEVADKCWDTDSPSSTTSGKVMNDSLANKPLSKEGYITFCQDANISLGSILSDKVELPGKPNGEMQRSKSAAMPSAPFDDIDTSCSMEDCKSTVPIPRSQSVLETLPLGKNQSTALPQSGNVGTRKMLIPRLPPSSKVSPCKQMTNIIIIPSVSGCPAAPPTSTTPKSRKKYKPIQPKQSPEGSRSKGGTAGNVRRVNKNVGKQSPVTQNYEYSMKEVRGRKGKASMGDIDAMADEMAGVIPSLTAEENALLANVAVSESMRTMHSATSSASVSRDAGIASTSSSTGGELMSIPCLEKDALDDYLHGSNSQEEELMRLFQNNSEESESLEQREETVGNSSEIGVTMANTVTDDSGSMVGNKTKKLSQLRLLLERNLTTSSNNEPTMGRNSSTEFSSTSTSAEFYGSSLSGRSESAGGRTKPVLPPLSSFGPGGFSGLGTRRRVSFETPVQELQTTTQSTCTTSSNVGMHASIPPSPNTRRQIFSFTPISPGHDSPGNVSMMSNLPTSTSSGNNASPFVSPQSTPVPRSRHDSGQTQPAHAPFVSPQATPNPFCRARHSSSGGMQGVRGNPNGSSQALSQLPSFRPRHSSGTNAQRHGGGQFSPGGMPLVSTECSTESNLPPPSSQQFIAPSETGLTSRTRHGSASSIPPASPGSAPHSPIVQSCSTQQAGSFLDSEPAAQSQGLLQAALRSRPNITHYQYKMPNTFGSNMSHTGDHQRQRHVSAGTALSTMHAQHSQAISGYREHDGIGSLCSPSGLQNPFQDPLGQEVSNLLSDVAAPLGPPPLFRSQSVPLHRMLAVDVLGMSNSTDLPCLNSILGGDGFGNASSVEGVCPSRSHPTTPLGLGQRFGFNMDSAASSVAPTPVPSEFADFGCMDSVGASSVLDGMGVTGGEDSLDNRGGDAVTAPMEGAEDSPLNAFLDDMVFLEGQSSVAGTRQFSSRSYPNTPIPEVGVAAAVGDTGINMEEANSRRSYGDAMLASRSYPSTPLISAPPPQLYEPTLNALNANPSGPAGSFSAQRNITDLLDQSQVESLQALLDCDSEFSQLVQEVDAIPEG